jgi:predicted  nucleic acid-binding Zn-ribbon protein
MEDTHEEKEKRYRNSQDDIKVMRSELNKLTGSVGDLVVAIKGNDLGTEGMLGQMKRIQEKVAAFEDRLDAAELAAKEATIEAAKKQFYLMIIWGLVGTVLGTIFMSVINHLFNTKKP